MRGLEPISLNFAPMTPKKFTSLYITQILSLENNPKIVCNMPKGAPTLVSYFADFETWTE